MSIITDSLRWVQRSLQALGAAVLLRFREEPILTVGLFRAAITVAVGFGLQWSGEQVALMVTFIEAVTAWVARREVTPTVAPVLKVGTVINERGSKEPTSVVVAQE